MPKPPRLCGSGCGRIVAHGATCPCQREATRARNARHDANRPSARERGYDSAWRKARAAFLQRFHWCAHPGCSERATVVDHVIPHKGDRALFWDRTNWQPLCGHHHSSTKQRDEHFWEGRFSE